MPTQLADILLSFRDFAEPLLERFGGQEEIEYLFYRYGWRVPIDEAVFNKIDQALSFKTSLEKFFEVAGPISERLLSDPKSGVSLQEAGELGKTGEPVISAIADFNLTSFSDLPEPLNTEDFWKDIGEHLIDDLLEEYVRIYQPQAYLVLHFAGVIRYDPAEPEGKFRRPYTRIVFDWDQLVAMVENPVTALKQTYKWGDPSAPFEYQRLFEALEKILQAIHLPVSRFAPTLQLNGDFRPGSLHRINNDVDALRTIFLRNYLIKEQIVYEVGLEMLGAARENETRPSGLLLRPVLRGGAKGDLQLGKDFALRWNVEASSGDAVGLGVFPDKIDLTGSGEPTVGASLEVVGTRTEPWYLLGTPRTARLELYSPSLKLSVEGTPEKPEARLHLRAVGANGRPGCKVVIPLDDADSFITETVRKEAIEISFSPEVIWSSETGLTFNGKPKLDIDLPLDSSIGPVHIQHVLLRLGSKGDGDQSIFEFEASAGLDTKLGPMQASIDRIGFRLGFDFERADKNLGFVDLSFGFKPPSGIGLAIDSTGLSGGGFLFLDSDRGQYAGVIQISFQNSITLTAIGLIATRLPNGAKGFSLVVIITAQDFKPIPLGLGFSLTGIGGLLAVNRTCDQEFLREGLKNKTLDNLLFPQDPIRNAPQIFGSLDSAFPARPGSYFFGPVLQIGWGTPPVLTMNLAVILELGNRRRLIILGQVKAILPSEKHDLLRLQMNALGVIDFDQDSISLDAVLFDSRLVGKFAITGSMAMRLNWGSAPVFALSIGGFHPAFKPPANFPALERLAISFSNSEKFRLRAETYIAITSNTLQFGAKLELYAKAAGFSVEGMFGFDVLIQFDPFFFIADFYASVQLKRGSYNLFKVKLEGHLSGPRPLHVKGKASFSIFWCDFSVSFDKTLVDGEAPPRLAPIDVMAQLKVALSDARNWTGHLAEGERRMVTLHELQGPDLIPLHPLGTLSVKQTVVPLELDIAKFGNAPPAGARQFKINHVTVSEKEVSFAPVKDFFAPSQFLELSDDEKLIAPSFEAMTAGAILGSTGFQITSNEMDILEYEEIKYETIILDKENDQSRKAEPATVTPDMLNRAVAFGAVARSPLRRAAAVRYRPAGGKNSLVKKGWTIASSQDGSPQGAPGLDAGKVVSYSESFQALQKLKEEDPEKAKRMMLIRVSRN
jgi:hypothetical protein